MAFRSPDPVNATGGLRVDGDVQIDAFGNLSRIINVPAASFEPVAAKTVFVNPTNATAVPVFMAGTAAFQYLRVNATNDGLEWAVLTVASPITLTSGTIGFDQTVNLNNNARVGIRKNSTGSTFLRRRLNLIEGSGVTLTVADDGTDEEVDITITGTAVGLTPIADQRVLGNDSGSSANPTAITVHQELDWIGGAGGGSVQWLFDGVDDRIDFGDILNFERTDPFTLSCWFSTTSAAAMQIMNNAQADSTSRGWSMFLRANGQLSFILANDNNAITNTLSIISTATGFNTGALSHFLITYDGSSTPAGVSFYLNGSTVAMTTFANTLSATTVGTNRVAIGQREDGLGSAFAGLLMHAAAWPSVLNSTQISEVYNLGAPPDLLSLPTAPDPVFWAKIDSSDTTGAGGVSDYGTGNSDGTAEGGLAPSAGSAVVIGSIPVRGSALWQPLIPGTSGFPLVSNGTGFLPSYKQILLGALPSIAAKSVLANATNASAVPTALAGSAAFQYLRVNSANTGLEWATLSGHASTSITYTSNTFQTAAFTGAITTSANSTTTAFGALAAKSVLANATNGSAVPAALAGSAAFQHLRVNSANTGLEWTLLSSGDFPAGVIPLTSIATQAADTFLGNFTAGVASPTARAGTSIAGSGLTYTTGGTLSVNNSFFTWSYILGNGNTSGANSPSINSGQQLIFAGIGASPAGGDIDAAGDLTLDSVGDMHLHPHAALHLGHTAFTTLVHIEGSTQVDIISGADILEQAATSIAVQAGTTWGLSTGAVLRLTVEADGSWNIGGSNGTDGQYLRSFGSAAPPQWSTIAISELPAIAAGSFLANVTAGVAAPTAHDLATFAGGGLTYTNVTGILAVGAGTGITVNANDIAVTIPLTDGDKGDITVASSGTSWTIDSAVITPTKVAVFGTPTNTGVPFIIYVSFAAGGGGAADDVTVFSSSAPFAFRILESWLVTATAVALNTVQARTATGGGGTALSTAMSATVAGKTSDNSTATSTVAASGSVFLRRSDSGIGGEFFAMCVRT